MKKNSILIILFLFIYNIGLAQFGETQIDDKVFYDDYKYILYTIKFKVEKYRLQDLVIHKGLIIVPSNDSMQNLVIYDIDRKLTTADSIIDSVSYWILKFNYEKEYTVAFKTYCLERGKELPSGALKSSEQKLTNFESLVDDYREDIQKIQEKQGFNPIILKNISYTGYGGWEETVKTLIDSILKNEFGYNEKYNINNFQISSEGTVNGQIIISPPNKTNDTLFIINLINHTTPTNEGNSYTYPNIDIEITKKF